MILKRKYLRRGETSPITAEWTFHFRDVVTGHEWTEGPFKNKITQGGLNNQAALFVGEVPSSTAAMHMVLGSNGTAAQLSDVIADMGETARKALASKTRSGSLARLRAYLTQNEGNGDHECVGLVARATDQAGSGELLNRLVQPISKTSRTVLTIEIKWTYEGV
ncbi:MAG: hypothetical protein ABFD08_08115 [Syntrophomonas sp.]